MKPIKNESIFLYFAKQGPEPTELGRRQFKEHQSQGIVPSEPDPYYTRLTTGKHWFDLQCREMQQGWITGDGRWFGWYDLYYSFKDRLDVLDALTSWHKKRPNWETFEKDEEDLFK